MQSGKSCSLLLVINLLPSNFVWCPQVLICEKSMAIHHLWLHRRVWYPLDELIFSCLKKTQQNIYLAFLQKKLCSRLQITLTDFASCLFCCFWGEEWLEWHVWYTQGLHSDLRVLFALLSVNIFLVRDFLGIHWALHRLSHKTVHSNSTISFLNNKWLNQNPLLCLHSLVCFCSAHYFV